VILIDAQDWVAVYWAVIAALALGGAAYVWLVWRQVRGLRGLAMLVALLCVVVIAVCFGGLHNRPGYIPTVWLLMVERAAWWPLLLSLLVLVDLYASDHGEHRAITTILYRRWERLRARKG
jgi:hypothetical protein